jgi:ferric-dicitrate binding protein FerR (iron transport regulator)
MISLQLSMLPSADGQSVSQEQQRQPLGSLSTVGEVYVNGSRALNESTVFTGDNVLTAVGGTATFTTSGTGSIKISPLSQVLVAGEPGYVAELKLGAAVMSSASGPSGVTLRIGTFVAVPTVRDQQTSASIERKADGSFVVSCLEGSVGVLPLQGGNGLFLQSGQSLIITASGELVTQEKPATAPEATAPAVTQAKKSYTGWIILAVAGAGGAGAAAALVSRGGKSVSPSAP